MRKELLDDFFDFHPAMIKYANDTYFRGPGGDRETVSLHFRLLTSKEPAARGLTQREHSSPSWYLKLMETSFDPSKVIFFVFSESSLLLRPFFVNAQARIPSLRFQMINEDFATSLAIMSMCQHHIVADSTFSFWGKLGQKWTKIVADAHFQAHIWTRSSRLEARYL
jgi:hypothetical protein